jgi:crotonobetainyl-CoA:carnitine CoA-transferase CaiB-like acyl-CoA transferase
MAEQALSHVRVVDLTHSTAGPYCTKLMAGFGAEVIKIERPGTGDKMRSVWPFFQDEPGLERSIPFLWLNTGKKSITLNLKTATGCDIFKKLVGTADVVMENFSPRVMPSLGLSWATLQQLNPRLVMTSISNFGQSGPYKDYQAEEIVEYALSGLMYLTGDPEKPPLCTGPAVTQYTAGMQAYLATLMALYQRGADGEGQYVEVSIQECALDNIEVSLAQHLHLGTVPKRTGDQHLFVPWQLYPCQDGYVAVIGGPVRHWVRGAELFEEPALLDKKYQHMAGRIEHRREVEALIQPWLSRHGKKDIYHRGQSRRFAFGYLADLAEVFDSPQHKAREYFVDIDHPVVGTHKHCGAPFRPSETPWQAVRAPRLGEHNAEVYGDVLGYSPTDLERLREEGII